jgi:hypothetical protein
MKFAMMAALTFGLCCTPAFAQTQAPDNGSMQAQDQDSAKAGKSWTGCISSKDGKFYLATKKHPEGVQIMSSDDLSKHVGHTVTVMGSMQKSTDASTPPMLNVTSMKMVSESCAMTKQ